MRPIEMRCSVTGATRPRRPTTTSGMSGTFRVRGRGRGRERGRGRLGA